MNQSMDKMRIEITEEINRKLEDQITSQLDRIEKYLRDKESSPHTNQTNTTPQQPNSSSASTTPPSQHNPTNTSNMQTSMFPNGLSIINVN
jgi:hypothetical protein